MRFYNYLGEEELDRTWPRPHKRKYATTLPDDMEDHELFNWVWREHGDLWHSIIENYSGVGEYKDLAQMAAIAVYNAVKLYDRERNEAKFTTYCYKAVKCELLSAWRAGKSKKRGGFRKVNILDLERAIDCYDLTLYNPELKRIDTEDEFDRLENGKTVMAILSELLDEDEIFVLKRLAAGFSQSEIAKELGCVQATVSKRLNSAKDKALENEMLWHIYFN